METDERQTEEDVMVGGESVAPDAPTPVPAPEPVERTVISSTTALPQDDRPQLSEEPFEAPEGNPMPPWAMGVVFAALAVIAAAVALAFLTPPTLALDRVLMDFDATQLEQVELSDSIYASNEGYQLVGAQPSGIEDDGTGRKVAYIDTAFENESFSVVVGVEQSYTLVDRQWVAGDYRITGIDAKPISPVSEELALADIDKVLSMVAPYRGVTLGRLYQIGRAHV